MQATWTFSPVVLCCTGVQLGVVLPGPALKQGAVDDQLGRGSQILHRRHVLLKSPGDQGRVGAPMTREVVACQTQ